MRSMTEEGDDYNEIVERDKLIYDSINNRVVSLNYRTIPKKRVHPTHLMNILRDSYAFGFQ